jgi:predicted enzyme related to lactoylglutathione lyase
MAVVASQQPRSSPTPAAMLHVKEIAYTGYPVTDISRARAFYEGVLGLKLTTQFDHEGRSWIEYDIGPATLAISNMSGEQWKPSRDGPSVALEVANFDQAIEALRGAQVPFLVEPMDTGVCRMAIVTDPDGNALTIHQRGGQ